MATLHEDKRQQMLAAAEALLLEQGFAGIKADAIVKRAYVSKGGFFHHFKSMDDLLRALFARLIDEFKEAMINARVEDDGKPGSFIRAYVIASLLPGKVKEWRRVIALSRAWIEIGLARPDLVSEMLSDRNILPDYYDPAHIARLEPRSQAPAVLVLLLATDAVWLIESLGIRTFTTAERERIAETLLQMSQLSYPASLGNFKKRRKK